MGLKPIGDRIIVRREAAEEKTSGGIILPDTAQNKPQKGEVLAVGPGKLKPDGTRAVMQLKAGDKVLFTSWAGDEFKDRKMKDEILVMHEGDVLCVID
ncbi:MAG TPA: co-chaperone GroES [Urbifossiella sp.]|jgi:chaperonin GroES|nr:co-chaperone GroES [Urbifossiella sp.]